MSNFVPNFCFNSQVEFIAENGMDAGGLRREFFSLFSNELHNSLEGPETAKTLPHDAIALQVILSLYAIQCAHYIPSAGR